MHASVHDPAGLAPPECSTSECSTSATFQTVDLPLDAFMLSGKIDLSSVKRITLTAPSGRVGIDNLEVNR